MVKLIAEIGNCHFGDYSKAKKMIRIAHESGADLIKGQAFSCMDIASNGSMSVEFYRQCQFTYHQMEGLIDYARSIGTDMFFSIFSPEYRRLNSHQNYTKFAANQTTDFYKEDFISFDKKNFIISMSDIKKFVSTMGQSKIHDASILFASKYFTSADYIDLSLLPLMGLVNESYGYSDHTCDYSNCIKAVRDYGATIIEKHFTLEKNISFEGKIFRDTVHGATPDELEKIANGIK